MKTITSNVMIKVGGNTFKCDCGCNVFTKEEDSEEIVYFCNVCGTYYSEDGDEYGTVVPES